MSILTAGDARCTIAATLGGSLMDWTIDGQPMLRRAEPGVRNPLNLSSFPLVPYSNRIGDARFEWRGRSVQLDRNFPPEPHAIHGVGWDRPWSVVEIRNAIVRMTLSHESDDSWPWPFDAEQAIVLGARELTLCLRATNRHDAAVPLAFGHHPYFDQRGARLRFQADTIWMKDERALPAEAVPPQGVYDFSAGAPVEGNNIDHCYTGWHGDARIDWVGRPLALEITGSSTLGVAVVYIPPGGNAFCFEPVANTANALNLPGSACDMPVIEPGQAFEAELKFRAVG